MTVHEDLWYGNVHPVEEFLANDKEYKGLLRIVAKNREALENELSQNQLDLFEKYNASANEINAVSETAAFRCGFTLAVSLLTE